MDFFKGALAFTGAFEQHLAIVLASTHLNSLQLAGLSTGEAVAVVAEVKITSNAASGMLEPLSPSCLNSHHDSAGP